MQANVLLFCDRCRLFRHHHPKGDTAMKCDECGVIRDGSFEIGGLSRLQIAWCRYHEHRIKTGRLTEWPGDWWDAQPGVWG